MALWALGLVDLVMRSRGLFRRNAAQVAMRPIIDGLASTRPTLLAKSGDSGLGIDNTRPWYHVYLTVDLRSDLEEIVMSAARGAGYQLQVNPGSSYLIAENAGRTLLLNITRDGEVRVFPYGPGVDWYQIYTPPAGRAILSLSLSLPDIR